MPVKKSTKLEKQNNSQISQMMEEIPNLRIRAEYFELKAKIKIAKNQIDEAKNS